MEGQTITRPRELNFDYDALREDACRDALEYAVTILSEFDDSQRSRWIERIIDSISKLTLSSPLLSLETFQSAVAICANKKSKSESLFNVFDIFSAPRFDYDDTLNKLVLISGETSAIGKCEDAVNLLRDRLKFVTQRVLRSTAFERYHLSTVETLLGSANKTDNVIVLGMLTQSSADSFQLEDLTGSMPVDLRNATFHSGLFTDGCIMLLEGSYNAGLLTVSGVGLAPIETADATRSFFGNENWFGGDSTVAYRTIPRLRSANAKNTDARIVFLSDVFLDDPTENVRMFYQKWMEEQAQKLVDATTKAFTQGRMGVTAPPLAAVQAGATPRMPITVPGPRGAPLMPPVGAPPMRGPMPFPYPPMGAAMGPPGMMMRPPFMMPPAPRMGMR
ncbi:putative DNA polymerase epsilon subunit 2 [Toxocara canis]|uniref:Putative DNA polymerase epsilon subunit 2 n=1 Tax=Toxocara canis TaxID=6265 RepID=A0A0B2V7P1_TOXCA|nr:putative DNA polymerase epsilon subunit 2 [Toxocara canis]